MKTLYYFGAGDDATILEHFSNKYDRYIFVDGMPDYKYYKPISPIGYQIQEHFIDYLEYDFGLYSRNGNILHFKDNNIFYYINTYYQDFELLDGDIIKDIYIKGFCPDLNYIRSCEFNNIYVADDTYIDFNDLDFNSIEIDLYEENEKTDIKYNYFQNKLKK